MMETIFVNGDVITMNPRRPRAAAFGISGDRFGPVGSETEIRQAACRNPRVVDLGGKTVVPGFIESHNHLSIYATGLLQADCSPAAGPTIDDIKGRIRALAGETPPGQWVRGWGYDDTLIAEKRHLTRRDLDDVTTGHPVFILHVSAHLAYANSRALEIAGIGPRSPQPEGGRIHMDDGGLPTGLLAEPAAIELVARHIPSYTTSQYRSVIPRAVAHYHRFGITSTHDAAIGYSGDVAEICRAYRQLEAQGRLRMRVYMTIVARAYDKLLELGLGTGFGSGFLKIGAVKLFQDGSIQALTAALTEEYLDRPERGDLIMAQDTLDELVEKYHRAGLQIAVHANGDAAIESVLQAYERAQRLHPRQDHRHMIIHCQMASDDHLHRMKALGVVPSFFVNHVYYWGDRHLSLFLGPERAGRIDPLASARRAGVVFSLHSDLPVTPVDPLFSIHTAVNRTTREGKSLGPGERISALDALRAYTVDAAYCSFEDNDKGAVAAGRRADFVVLSDNPLTVAPEKIKDIRVLATFVGGRAVYGDI